jgi:putative glutamine amidotransferase
MTNIPKTNRDEARGAEGPDAVKIGKLEAGGSPFDIAQDKQTRAGDVLNIPNTRGDGGSTAVQERPRVGVPYRTSAEEAAGNNTKHAEYCSAVRAAGGEPVAVSLQLGDSELKKLARTLDAYVLPGSPADVDPALYKAKRNAKCGEADAARERTDYALLDDAFANAKPVLAICYGAQILNVRLGGTLFQDIESELPRSLNHTKDGVPKGQPDPVHDAVIESGGGLAQIAAETGIEQSGDGFWARVNTSHHQSVRDLGYGLRVAARASDGGTEAVEREPAEMNKHWVMGVQWHPERPTHEKLGDALSEVLFRAFMKATREAATRTAGIRR